MSAAKQPLGRLERLDVRDCWVSESGDFTPWLAHPDNIALLGNAIGIDLEVQHQEHRVGLFRADIVCTDTGCGHRVLIENQLARTDHSHLGQLLTYAAGLEAVKIIWIAERFTDEHRAALDWLNRVTDDTANFFGVEIELWRIGTSEPAPKFNVVAKPNQWTDTISKVRDLAGLSETDERYLEYWTAFRELALAAKNPLRMQKASPQSWMLVSIGRAQFTLAVAASRQKKLGYVQLVIYEPNRLHHFTQLKADKSAIEATLGPGVEWREMPEKQESQVRRDFSGFDLDNRSDWPRQHELLLKTLTQFHACFAPRIKTIGKGDLELEEASV